MFTDTFYVETTAGTCRLFCWWHSKSVGSTVSSNPRRFTVLLLFGDCFTMLPAARQYSGEGQDVLMNLKEFGWETEWPHLDMIPGFAWKD
jgi:hypothetical protein